MFDELLKFMARLILYTLISIAIGLGVEAHAHAQSSAEADRRISALETQYVNMQVALSAANTVNEHRLTKLEELADTLRWFMGITMTMCVTLVGEMIQRRLPARVRLDPRDGGS
jgi:hypothetical protein